ncbi:hypothetical protein PV409_17130 [Streptomyces sp. ME02-6979.5a]|uniref:hypothetical protein n=1 Tax=Streptomyces sp. ME02-6979.5a TaxID=462925 RepID=UPI0029A87AD2|nr:hypothetical protein [Streptomyces sp. ME02-6979.5a]MDX3339688.1 hypothetical protein [Streptomyces sp. ME02-6979.5a]
MRSEPSSAAGRIDQEVEKLVRHALKEVPYYRDAYAGGASALSDLAVLGKASVRGRELAFLTDGFVPSGLLFVETSGTTGTPLRRYYKSVEGTRAALPLWKARRWYGVTSPRMQACRFSSDENDEGRAKVRGSVLSLSVRDLSDAAFQEYHDALHQHRPVWFQVVPSVAGLFSRWLAERGLTGPDSLRLIELNSEPTLPGDRSAIRTAFPSAQLADHYGSKETWCVAYECPQSVRHIMTENLTVEVLTDNGPAAHGTGALIVTNHRFQTMPLLRYDLGDRVTVRAAECGCGLSGPAIDVVEGRIAEYALGDAGEPVYQTFFDIGVRRALKAWPGSIARYQFRQTGAELTAVIEPGRAWTPEAGRVLAEYLKPTFFASEVSVLLGGVVHLPGRKFRSIYSQGPDRPGDARRPVAQDVADSFRIGASPAPSTIGTGAQHAGR